MREFLNRVALQKGLVVVSVQVGPTRRPEQPRQSATYNPSGEVFSVVVATTLGDGAAAVR
jgi:hypothetical protein